MNKLPLVMNTLHAFLVVFRDRCRFETETVRGGCKLGRPAGWAGAKCAGAGRARYFKFLRVRGGFKFCGAGADKKFQPAEDSTVSPIKTDWFRYLCNQHILCCLFMYVAHQVHNLLASARIKPNK